MQSNGIRLRPGERRWLWFFLAPTLFGLTFGTDGPVLAAIGISFTNWDVLTPPVFAGLDNYIKLFTDPTFKKSILNTVVYVLGTVPAATVLALMLALLLNQKLRGVTFYRTAYFLPVVSSTVAVALVWSWIYSKDFGLLNYLLRGIGVEPIAWLTSTRYAMLALIIMGIWGLLGEGMIIFLAGLQGISQSYYESAEVDGANGWGKFLHITLPLITPSMFFYFLITIINAFQAFEQIYVMTRGGPSNATTTMVYYIYNNAFRNFRMGYASAQAIALFLIVMVLTLIYWRLQEKWVVYDD
ncbi:MAG TPA: sugar ABC transporter permease [Anaerolinea sp.]|nr:sugar ABC transporter permease [Anaerolinea sp.]